MKTINTYELPVYYGTALINDDWSGLEDVEVKELTQWLEDKKPGYCVNVGEETFISRFNGLITECSNYDFIVD